MGIKSLLDGYSKFKRVHYQEQRELYEKLEAEGQSPKVLFIACCDSRCDPSIITQASPGELFVIRNVANMVPPYTPDGKHHGTSAAIEFAVKYLKVEHVVVMGHAQCGGVKHLLSLGTGPEPQDDFLTDWVVTGTEARDRVVAKSDQEGFDAQLELEYEMVRLSLQNLMTFRWVKKRVDSGELQLHGWYFGIGSGELKRLDPDTDQFVVIEHE